MTHGEVAVPISLGLRWLRACPVIWLQKQKIVFSVGCTIPGWAPRSLHTLHQRCLRVYQDSPLPGSLQGLAPLVSYMFISKRTIVTRGSLLSSCEELARSSQSLLPSPVGLQYFREEMQASTIPLAHSRSLKFIFKKSCMKQVSSSQDSTMKCQRMFMLFFFISVLRQCLHSPGWPPSPDPHVFGCQNYRHMSAYSACQKMSNWGLLLLGKDPASE